MTSTRSVRLLAPAPACFTVVLIAEFCPPVRLNPCGPSAFGMILSTVLPSSRYPPKVETGHEEAVAACYSTVSSPIVLPSVLGIVEEELTDLRPRIHPGTERRKGRPRASWAETTVRGRRAYDDMMNLALERRAWHLPVECLCSLVYHFFRELSNFDLINHLDEPKHAA